MYSFAHPYSPCNEGIAGAAAAARGCCSTASTRIFAGRRVGSAVRARACSDATRIRTRVDHVWTIDEQVLPLERVAATGRYDLSDRALCGLGLDHGFGGWSGSATFSDPMWPFEITLSSPYAAFFSFIRPKTVGCSSPIRSRTPTPRSMRPKINGLTWGCGCCCPKKRWRSPCAANSPD